MRRRRRTPTRIIHRKSPPTQTQIYNTSGDKKGKAKKVFFTFFIVIILAAISYVIYFQNYKDSSVTNVKTHETSTKKAEPVVQKAPPKPLYKLPEKKIQIEVLNGCGKKGIAKIFESYLRDQGYDVVNTENYRIKGKIFWNVEYTNVIDQIGNQNFASSVANSLGIDDKHISSIDNPSPLCDVTVIIGKDFAEVKGFKEFSK